VKLVHPFAERDQTAIFHTDTPVRAEFLYTVFSLFPISISNIYFGTETVIFKTQNLKKNFEKILASSYACPIKICYNA
jgi:hypothetical protein